MRAAAVRLKGQAGGFVRHSASQGEARSARSCPNACETVFEDRAARGITRLEVFCSETPSAALPSRQFQEEGTLAMAVATRIEPLLVRVAYACALRGVDSRGMTAAHAAQETVPGALADGEALDGAAERPATRARPSGAALLALAIGLAITAALAVASAAAVPAQRAAPSEPARARAEPRPIRRHPERPDAAGLGGRAGGRDRRRPRALPRADDALRRPRPPVRGGVAVAARRPGAPPERHARYERGRRRRSGPRTCALCSTGPGS